jgi:inositol polyphosphate 5-phosphatase INPP5A
LNQDNLIELKIIFPPSYPFMEDLENYEKYMESRCPAWCDRILLNKSLGEFILKENNFIYDMMGQKTCMGDHKVIYINMN